MGKVNLLTLFIVFASCAGKKTELLWDQSIYQIGSQSSPRASDLNQDGVLDIVIGAGKAEMMEVDYGVLAINGQDGELLWHAPASAHVVGSPTFLDITGDGVDDVVIGGRGHFLAALNGRTGDFLWTYDYRYEDHPILQFAKYNFYNSSKVPDQNGDDLEEILIINGGNWNAAPDSTDDRYPGVLMLIDPSDGSILAADTMPDGKESYMSPISFRSGGETWSILIGTGGETIGGSLYLTTLKDLHAQNLRAARALVHEEEHGFIAPPALVDLNEDGQLDVISVSHAGRMSATNIFGGERLWEYMTDGFEVSSTPAIGQFNNDQVPDALFMLCKGVWPTYSISKQLVLNGRDGTVLYEDSLGCFALSSAVAYDLDRDGIDEAIMSLNQYDCDFTLSEDTLSPTTMQNQLIAVDFDRSVVKVIEQKDRFRNIFSTPWIGDIDKDGYLDIVYSQYFNHRDIRKYQGMTVKRISTHIRCKKKPRWGGYMGSEGDGVY